MALAGSAAVACWELGKNSSGPSPRQAALAIHVGCGGTRSDADLDICWDSVLMSRASLTARSRRYPSAVIVTSSGMSPDSDVYALCLRVGVGTNIFQVREISSPACFVAHPALFPTCSSTAASSSRLCLAILGSSCQSGPRSGLGTTTRWDCKTSVATN